MQNLDDGKNICERERTAMVLNLRNRDDSVEVVEPPKGNMVTGYVMLRQYPAVTGL